MNNFLCSLFNKLLLPMTSSSCLGLSVCLFLCFPLNFVLGIDIDVEALLAGR